MSDHEIDVEVRDSAWCGVVPDPSAYCRDVALQVLSRLDGSYELSIVLGDDALLQELNRTYRGKDEPKDVLSFESDTELSDARNGNQMRHLGDVVIAHGVATRDATDRLGLPAEQHLAHLVVHGILHLLGHDHEAESDAQVMEKLEVKILGEMGIEDPYRVAVSSALEGSGTI